MRKRAGIEFAGSTMDMVGRLAHVRLPEELRRRGRLRVPRPDGYVAWASDTADSAADGERLQHAMTRWCGMPVKASWAV